MANRLKNALWLIVGAVVAVWALTSLVGLVRAGDMDPPGPPGGTMKTLIAVEPRTPIWGPDPGDFPIVISQPGSYYLGENINGEADKDGILIMADNVTLDLNGFTLKGADGKSSYNGITVPVDPTGAVYNLSIFNGTIRDWGAAGIGASDPDGEAINSRLADLILMHNGGPGVRVGLGSIVSRVNASDNDGNGIQAAFHARVSDSASAYNRGDGIWVQSAAVITDSVVRKNWGDGIDVTENSVVSGCDVDNNEGDGIRVENFNLVVGNEVSGNGTDAGHGIHVTGMDNRIEGNSAVGNGEGMFWDGIHVSGRRNHIEANVASDNWGWEINTSDGLYNLIIKNSAGGQTGGRYKTSDWDLVGQIIMGGGTFTSDQPWANFSY